MRSNKRGVLEAEYVFPFFKGQKLPLEGSALSGMGRGFYEVGTEPAGAILLPGTERAKLEETIEAWHEARQREDWDEMIWCEVHDVGDSIEWNLSYSGPSYCNRVKQSKEAV